MTFDPLSIHLLCFCSMVMYTPQYTVPHSIYNAPLDASSREKNAINGRQRCFGTFVLSDVLNLQCNQTHLKPMLKLKLCLAYIESSPNSLQVPSFTLSIFTKGMNEIYSDYGIFPKPRTLLAAVALLPRSESLPGSEARYQT